MSVADSFKAFCENINIPQSTVSCVRERYQQITKRINLDYWGSDSKIKNSLYVGSYGRDTDIHTSDIDILVILPNSVFYRFNRYTAGGQSALLQDVKEVIKKTYSTTYIRADGQVIVLRFTDGITFEIVPCFLNNDYLTFRYPDTNNGGSWKVTNPRAEIKAINDGNKLYNKNLKRLCRMLRAWKEKNDVNIGGLLIDTLAYNFLSQWEYKFRSFMFYDWMSRDCFKYLMNQNSYQTYWKAVGSGQFVWRTSFFENKAKLAYEHSVKAIFATSKGRLWTATNEWREIYGNKFPHLLS
jgi:predicted nucleotidyltransferase